MNFRSTPCQLCRPWAITGISGVLSLSYFLGQGYWPWCTLLKITWLADPLCFLQYFLHFTPRIPQAHDLFLWPFIFSLLSCFPLVSLSHKHWRPHSSDLSFSFGDLLNSCGFKHYLSTHNENRLVQPLFWTPLIQLSVWHIPLHILIAWNTHMRWPPKPSVLKDNPISVNSTAVFPMLTNLGIILDFFCCCCSHSSCLLYQESLSTLPSKHIQKLNHFLLPQLDHPTLITVITSLGYCKSLPKVHLQQHNCMYLDNPAKTILVYLKPASSFLSHKQQQS